MRSRSHRLVRRLILRAFRAPITPPGVLFFLLVVISPLPCRAQVDRERSSISPRLYENQGQVRDTRGNRAEDVLYSAREGSVLFAVRRTGFSYVFRRQTSAARHIASNEVGAYPKFSPPDPDILYRVDVEFVGADRAVCTGSVDSSGPVERYYRGGGRGIQALPMDHVVLGGLYPGVDAVIRSQGAGLKYDLVIAPAAHPSTIRMRYVGAEAIETTAEGGLVITTPLGRIIEGAPLTWQEDHETKGMLGLLGVRVDQRRLVESRFVVRGDEVSIELGEHDRSRPVIFDPSLLWSTYYGGRDLENIYNFGGNGGAVGRTIDADLEGYVVIGGTTRSIDFPTTPGVIQQGLRAFFDCALVAFGPDGSRRWSTYLGGSNWDLVAGVALDSQRRVVVTGITNSSDFPTTPGVAQGTLRGSNYDMFVSLLDSTGRLVWGSYYGGTDGEHAGGCSFDPRGRVVIGGTTWSTDLPVSSGAFQTSSRSKPDAFLVAFDGAGKQRWGTYLGGTGEEWASWLACDRFGGITIAGGTWSTDFPVSPGVYQGTSAGERDAFVAQFDTLGRRRWITYVGGSGTDWAYGVDCDPSGNVAVGGQTRSDNFQTTPGSAQRTIAGTTSRLDGFVMLFDRGGRRKWSTYYGGSRNDNASGVASAPSGNVYLVGSTLSLDLMHSERNYQDSLQANGDLFIAEFDSLGRVMWDTYYGGSGVEIGSGIAGDCFGGVVVAGETSSRDLPIVGGIQPRLNTTTVDTGLHKDFFIARFCNTVDLRPVPNGPTTLCSGDSVVLSVPPGYRHYRWIPTNDTARSITVRASGVYSILILDSLGCQAITDTLGVIVHVRPKVSIRVVGSRTLCDGEWTLLQAETSAGIRWRWSTGDTARSIRVSAPGIYTVQAMDTTGCWGTSPPDTIVVLARARAPVISTDDTVWVCPDSLALLDAGAGYTSYRWSNGIPSRSVWVGPGSYWVRVEDGIAPCPAFSDTVTVALRPGSVPVIVGGEGGVICQGDTLRLDAGAGYLSYRWSTGDSTRYIRVVDSGAYSVRTISPDGCLGRSQQVLLRVAPTPQPVARAAGPTTFCRGDTLVLAVDSGFAEYRWSTGETTSTIHVVASGRFDVVVISSDGCTGRSSPVDVVVHPGPSGTIGARGPTQFTEGDSVALDVTGDFASCTWSTGDTSRTIIVKSSGAYGVVLVDSNGCTLTIAGIDVIVVPPIPEAFADVSLPSILVSPGERFVLPVVFRSANLMVNGVDGLTAELRFDRTLATPIGLTPAGWTDGDDRVIPLVLTVEGDTLPALSLEFVTTLGATLATPLRLVNLLWRGDSVPTTITSGELRLDGVCVTGSGRLVVADGDLILRPVRPNPLVDQAEVEFEIVEDGWTRLVLVDAVGRVVCTLVDRHLRRGPYVVPLSRSALPSGAYRLVMQTARDRREVPVVIAW